MPNFFRNVDDSISDPELIAAKYKIGRSVFFEVQLVLAELSESISTTSGQGSISGSPDFIQGLYSESPIVGGGCPADDQYFWVERKGKPVPVIGRYLYRNWKIEQLYDPITGEFSDIDNCVQITQPVLKLRTKAGAVNIVSYTHKVIKNTSNLDGTKISNYVVGQEILSFEKPHYIHSDQLLEISNFGVATTLAISLKRNFRYISGDNKILGIAVHNRKDPGDLDDGAIFV